MPKPQSTPSTTQQRKKNAPLFSMKTRKNPITKTPISTDKNFNVNFFFPKQSPGVAPFFVICVTLLG
jgi:hypothetical protein